MKLIGSPLNYTGGKFRLLPQIRPLFPREIATFVDLFCGGGVVGANVECQRVCFNDINDKLINLLQLFRQHDIDFILENIETIIGRYGLSDSGKMGYGFYGCESGKGLGAYNKSPYLRMRDYLNSKRNLDDDYYLHLYVAMVYAFNNQMRFNSKGSFNLPVGKRDFNGRMRKKLCEFVERLHSIEVDFSARDFAEVDLDVLGADDFVYADPPYLITCATYNENGGWSEAHEHQLYATLDALHGDGVRFALSNVLSTKGKENGILARWLEEHPEYTCHHLNYTYSNSNYHKKDRDAVNDEVLIVNY